MEMNELRYFKVVAEIGNVNRAANELLVSPGTISKAISRLEENLGVNLFERVGRTIQITPKGRLLQLRASQILNLEETTRNDISDGINTLNIKLCGTEVLLSEYGLPLIHQVQSLYPNSLFNMNSCSTEQAIEKVYYGEAHIGFISELQNVDLASKLIDKSESETYIGVKHPLYKYAKANQVVAVDEVLKHNFVIPEYQVISNLNKNQSVDGWRDDKFSRKIGYRVSSIKSIEALLHSGLAIAYLPNYLAQSIGAKKLKVKGCPYTCKQSIYMTCRNPKELGWLNQIW